MALKVGKGAEAPPFIVMDVIAAAGHFHRCGPHERVAM